MDLGLSGRAVFIVGASRGLGFAAACAFAAEGARLAIGARDQATLDDAVVALKSFGTEVWAETVDVAREGAAATWSAHAAARLGGADALVLTPSAQRMGNSPADWAANLTVDIQGSADMIEANRIRLASAAQQRGDASVTLLSSAAAVLAYGPSAYGPLKAGLVNLCAGYARLLAKDGIRVNAVSPGPILTPRGSSGHQETEKPLSKAPLLQDIPLGRFGQPAEIGDAIAFLASPRSAFTSGANLRIDGAMTTRVDL